MEYDEKEFEEFTEKFGGDFVHLIPDYLSAYELGDVDYLLPGKDETLIQIKESFKNNVNLLIANPICHYNQDCIY